MKRILNIIGIFFLSIIVFTSCQKSPEELNEGSPQTRAAGVTGTYYCCLLYTSEAADE